MIKGSSKFKGKTTMLCFYLSDQDKSDYQAYAAANGMSVSRLVRDALADYIKHKNEELFDAPTARKIQSFHEVDESDLD